MKRAFIIFSGVSLLIIAVLWSSMQSYLDQPLKVPVEGYTFVVEKGASLSRVTDELAEQGILQWPRVLAVYGRLGGVAASIKAGEYQVNQADTAASLLDLLVSGKVRLHTLTVIEGWTYRDLLAALSGHPAIEQTLTVATAEQLATALNLNYPHAEGLFYPDTYRFPRGMSDAEFLRRAHEVMQEKLRQAWQRRAPDLLLDTPYEALILASIVEKESALDSERADIAGVFFRRLQKKMRLQTDPTVIYGLGDSFDGNLTRQNLRTDTPYNTYTRRGLPPTPIALPGISSIEAVLHPADGDTLYFVATGQPDGSHYFSKTLDEHNQAVARYLKTLRQRKQEQSP